ncbi:MAG: DMT family transporter [Pseudomonadota bacterium]
MATRTAPGVFDFGLLVVLAFIWGSAFLLSKVAVAEVDPVTVTLIRQLLAGLLLVGAVVVTQKIWFQPTRTDLTFMIICALTGTVIPFTLINWGVQVIDSGLAAILMGFMPIVILLLAHIFTVDEKLTIPKVAGVALGLVGLAVLFWPQLMSGFGDNIIRQVAVLGAATAYGINALATKKLVQHQPLVLMAYITLMTWPILIGLAFAVENPTAIRPSMEVTFALIAMGVFPSAVGALLMFKIIERQGASFFGQINLLVPVAGVLLGAIFLGERPGISAIIALIIIFSGIGVARMRFDGIRKSTAGTPS